MALSRSLFKEHPVRPIKDFAPVAPLRSAASRWPHPSGAARNVAGFIALARREPVRPTTTRRATGRIIWLCSCSNEGRHRRRSRAVQGTAGSRRRHARGRCAGVPSLADPAASGTSVPTSGTRSTRRPARHPSSSASPVRRSTACSSPAMSRIRCKQGLQPTGRSADPLARLTLTDLDRGSSVVREAKVQPG